MDYQDSGNYSCIFHIGNCNFDNHRRDKTI